MLETMLDIAGLEGSKRCDLARKCRGNCPAALHYADHVPTRVESSASADGRGLGYCKNPKVTAAGLRRQLSAVVVSRLAPFDGIFPDLTPRTDSHLSSRRRKITLEIRRQPSEKTGAKVAAARESPAPCGGAMRSDCVQGDNQRNRPLTTPNPGHISSTAKATLSGAALAT